MRAWDALEADLVAARVTADSPIPGDKFEYRGHSRVASVHLELEVFPEAKEFLTYNMVNNMLLATDKFGSLWRNGRMPSGCWIHILKNNGLPAIGRGRYDIIPSPPR